MTETSIDYLAENKLYLGNSFELLKRVRPESTRLVLCDPPYEISRPNNLTTMGRTGINFTWDYGFSHASWLPLADAALQPGGSMVVWEDWKKLGALAEALTALGYDVKRNLTWLKRNPMPRNILRSFTQATECAVWAVKPGAKWIFNRRPGIKIETGVFSLPIPTGKPRHPAAKPVAMFSALIEILSKPGELVLDPFAGAAVTAIAARALGRKFICIEKAQGYVDMAPPEIERGRV